MSARLLAARRDEVGKHLRILPVVVPERKFVDVQWQIFLTDMVKTADNTALQERPEAVNMGSMDVAAHVLALAMAYELMRKYVFQQSVAAMFVSRNQGDFIADRFPHETIQGFCVGVLNDLGDDVSLAGDSANDRNLASSAAAWGSFVFVAVLVFSADVGLIHLDFSAQLQGISSHRSTESMTHIPRSVIVGTGIFAKDHAMDLQGADSFLADEHQVSHFEPQLQRNLCILKDGAGNDREAVAISPATVLILTDPVERAGLERIDLLAVAPWTADPGRPPHFSEVLFAGFFIRKLAVKSVNGLHALCITQSALSVNSHLIALSKGFTFYELDAPLYLKGPGKELPDQSEGIVLPPYRSFHCIFCKLGC